MPQFNFRQLQAYRRAGGRSDKKSAQFELTEEQKQEIREAFDLFDTDGSGTQSMQHTLFNF